MSLTLMVLNRFILKSCSFKLNWINNFIKPYTRTTSSHTWSFHQFNTVYRRSRIDDLANLNEIRMKYVSVPWILKAYASSYQVGSSCNGVIGDIQIPLSTWKDFMAVYPEIVNELTEITKNVANEATTELFKRFLEYNTSNGKQFRAILLMSTYAALVKNVTSEERRLIYLLAWCNELYHYALLVLDDVLDNSITRRKKLCWYKVNGVGLEAVRQYFMLQNAIYLILQKYFSYLSNFVHLINSFHEMEIYCGSHMEILICTQNVNTFTYETYRKIATYKTGYTVVVPVALAMNAAGSIYDSPTFDHIKRILLEIGELYQARDDVLDCFGSEELTGKTGTDIENNKCSWLVVECMIRSDAEQKKILTECYGKNDPEKIARVKQLYLDLNLPGVYQRYEETRLKEILQLLGQLPSTHPLIGLITNFVYWIPMRKP